jgi:hypothetical protein
VGPLIRPQEDDAGEHVGEAKRSRRDAVPLMSERRADFGYVLCVPRSCGMRSESSKGLDAGDLRAGGVRLFRTLELGRRDYARANNTSVLHFRRRCTRASIGHGHALHISRLNGSAVMVNEHTAFRVDWMPFAGLETIWAFGVGGIPYSIRDMQIEKMLVVKSSELQM